MPLSSLSLRLRTTGALIAAALAFAGCANPFADEPAVDAGPSRELAETPAEIPEEVAGDLPGASPTPAGSGEDGSGSDGPGDGSDGGSDEGDGSDGATPDGGDGGDVQGSDGEASAGPGSGATATTDDRAGDHGLRAPGYADLRAVTLEDRGRDLRITVAFADEVPQRLPDGETQGVGVDLYRRSGEQEESAHQVFVDGGPEGWFAYFTTPQGFERYPGTFGIGSNVMVFEVPWAALKLPDQVRFSAFCDWTRRTTGVVNLFSEDHAPDDGTTTLSR